MTLRKFFKSITGVGLLALAIMSYPPSAFAGQSCTISVLKGRFGFASNGYIAFGQRPPLLMGSFYPIAVGGTVTFETNGKVSRSVDGNAGGQVFHVSDSGTYTLNANCIFTVVHGNGEVWRLVPVNRGAQLNVFVVSVPGAVAVGEGTLTAQ